MANEPAKTVPAKAGGDKAKPEARLLIRNIGLLLSGDLRQPILDADTVVAVDGKITAVGKEKDIDGEGATLVIDARGTTLAPGLIDSHVHLAFDGGPNPAARIR